MNAHDILNLPAWSFEWDRAAHESAALGLAATQHSPDGRLIARTANPLLNPGAVSATESSTRYRRCLVKWDRWHGPDAVG